jgi:hypothetical protein
VKVFIANFGRGNYEWANCRARATVATMNSHDVHGFWMSGDRDRYVDHCLRHGITAAGIKPTKPVASRWFNLMTIISESARDIWIHREKDQLWWTMSRDDPPTIMPDVDPTLKGDQRVFVCHKPCEPWSDANRAGNRLSWNGLHPKAKEFLFTEGTLQQLRDENAAYAIALINGDALSLWHNTTIWQAKVARTGKNPAISFNARQKSVWEMANTARATATQANGQQVLRTIKNKEVRFNDPAFEQYIDALIASQDGLCALTDIKLQFRGDHEDEELLCSLDRIDSDGHYEEGNLQIVCRFANRWKSDRKDEEFRRLIGVVRSSAAI